MSNAWKTVGTIVLVIVLLGAILCGVGFITGADTARIMSVVENHYLINATYQWIMNIASQII